MLGKILFRYLKPYKWWLLGVLVFQFASALATFYLPSLNADIIDEGVSKGDTAYIWRTGLFMLTISLGQITASIIATYFAARAAMSAGRDIRDSVFERVSNFSEREVSKFGPGSLITRNTNDVQQVQMLAMMGGTFLVTAPILAIGGIIFALRQDVGLSWIIAVAVPTLLVIAVLIISRMVPLFRSYQSKLDNVNRIMREQLTGVRVVRAFVREPIEEERFRGANTDIMVVGRKVGSLFVLLFPLFMLVLNVTVVAVVWFGAFEVNDGDVQIGTLFAFMQYVMLILTGVLMASFMTIMIPRAAVSAERIAEVLDSQSTLVRPENPVHEFPAPGTVAFADAEFSYPGAQQPVLSGITFAAAKGETVAIVGSTGAGKTTLISLIPRLFDVTGGVSGSAASMCARPTSRSSGTRSAWCRSVRSSSPARSHRTCATGVKRPPTTTSGTRSRSRRVATSSKRWRAGSTRASRRAARTSRAGSASVSPSPGPSCTDPTSSCSTTRSRRSTSRPTRDSGRRSGANCPEVTKIVVAQRVSTITDADRIVVLDDGRMVGIGTHEQLLESSSTYREIVESQLGVEAAR